MKKVNKLKIDNNVLKLLLSGGMMFSLTACRNEDKISISVNELMKMEELANDTLMDELTKDGKLSYKNMDLVDAVDQLDDYLTILEKTNSYKGLEIKHSFSIPEINIEYVDNLLSNLETKDNNLKEESLEKLSYINLYCSNWINQNGLEISVEFMIHAIKSAVADRFGISVKDYDESVRINHKNISEPFADFFISVGNDIYSVPYESGELWDTILSIYRIQDAMKDGSIKDNEVIFKYCKNYIYRGKHIMEMGIDNDNGDLVTKNDDNYINEHFNKETKSI